MKTLDVHNAEVEQERKEARRIHEMRLAGVLCPICKNIEMLFTIPGGAWIGNAYGSHTVVVCPECKYTGAKNGF